MGLYIKAGIYFYEGFKYRNTSELVFSHFKPICRVVGGVLFIWWQKLLVLQASIINEEASSFKFLQHAINILSRKSKRQRNQEKRRGWREKKKLKLKVRRDQERKGKIVDIKYLRVCVLPSCI